MAATPVGPRAGKDEFMRALGLTPGDSRCEGCYRAMREEAIVVYNEINADRNNLRDEPRNDPTVRTPFFWHHVREDVREAAVRRTWQNATPGTVQRHYFDLGQTNGDHGPNWVTLWLLYSVFRSRDIRNNRQRRAETQDTTAGHTQGARRIFDPARNLYLPI